MCGILAIFGIAGGAGDASKFRHTALKLSRRLRHRGPDWNGIFAQGSAIIAHERLAVMDPVSGAQPLYSEDKDVVLGVNGEIYNYLELRESLEKEYKFSGHSDCEVILHLYQRHKSPEFVNQLIGMYSFVLYDCKSDRWIAARDHVGITPLYIGYGHDGGVWFASEMKALSDHCAEFRQFPPGSYYDSQGPKENKIISFYNPAWAIPDTIPDKPLALSELRNALISSVKSHLMSDVPFGVLLSGGVDSSLIASITSRLVQEQLGGLDDIPKALRVRSFSVGLNGSPDLVAARAVAKFLQTNHHEFTYTIQEGIDALSDVIYHLETFDVTTIRAATPMYLMARLIKATGVKMVLSGEGADEIFGGYLYFHKAPNAKEFHEETVRKVKDLHMYDCLRANKAPMAFGVEVRVPFLDKEFLDFAMSIDPRYKMAIDEISGKSRIEKHCLRKAFEVPPQTQPHLPDNVLWRQKEQLSDGVGYSWIDSLKETAECHVTDAMMETARYRFVESTPLTKEAYFYRQLFESHFPQRASLLTVPYGPSVACSTPIALKWDAAFAGMADPSGRAVTGVHIDSYESVKV